MESKGGLTRRKAQKRQMYEKLNRQASARAVSLCYDLKLLVQHFGNEISRQRLIELDTQARIWYNTHPETFEGHRWLYRRYRRLFRQFRLAFMIEWVHKKLNRVKRKIELFR